MQFPRFFKAVCTIFSILTGGCLFGASADPALKETEFAPLRPCYVPRADLFYFEQDWLHTKGRELDALKFGNALWWLGEASWNESVDAQEIYGAGKDIFVTLSRAVQTNKSIANQRARFLFLEERDEPLAPVLMSVQITDQRAFFYVKSLSRGKPRDPGGLACWGGLVIQEQRPLLLQEAQPVLDCVRNLMEDRVRAEPWKPLPQEGREVSYLVEYQAESMHGLAQFNSLSSNLDGVNLEQLQRCYQSFLSLSRKKSLIPMPATPTGS